MRFLQETDQRMRKRLLSLGVAILAVGFLTAPVGAAIIGITAATWDDPSVVNPGLANPIVNHTNLTSITAGTTYSVLTAATSAATVDSGSLGGTLLYPVNESAPTDGLAAVTDGLNATTGVANIGDGVNFFFGQNVDGANLFFVDYGGPDATLVRPIDGTGALIGDFTLNTAVADLTQFAIMNRANGGTDPLRGLVFNTSDFSGSGVLSGVEGIRLAASGFDPMVVGIAAPEPGSLALVFIGACGVALLRRRAS